MQELKLSTLVFLTSMLIACQFQPALQESKDQAGLCNASAVQTLLGEQASPELLDQARRESGAPVARIVRPGDVVTLEHNEQRLTLATDETFEIQRISCG